MPVIQPRMLLWGGLLILLWVNFTTWMKDYAPVGRESAPAISAPAGATDASSAAPPASGLTDALPAIPGDAAAPGLPAAADQETSAPARPVVRVQTDVLDLDLSLAGGELIRADLLAYPLHKDDPTTPVRLFNVDSPETQFTFQSGLTTGVACSVSSR